MKKTNMPAGVNPGASYTMVYGPGSMPGRSGLQDIYNITQRSTRAAVIGSIQSCIAFCLVEVYIAEPPNEAAAHVMVKAPDEHFPDVVKLHGKISDYLMEIMPVGLATKLHIFSDSHKLPEDAAAAWSEAVLEKEQESTVSRYLDMLAADTVALSRKPGESDEDLRSRVVTAAALGR